MVNFQLEHRRTSRVRLVASTKVGRNRSVLMPPEANYESWADKAHYTDLSFQLIMSYCDDKIKKYYLGETGNSSL